MSLHSYPAGTLIFRQHDDSDTAYVIQSGEVEIFRETESGGAERVAILKAGAMFGEMAAEVGGLRTASARAHTDCTLQPIRR